MSYYGGTITVEGRNMITSLIAGDTIEFTRILVGSGKMPEGVEPIDMKELVNPVAEASSTNPIVNNNVLSMVVEYRNDMNGGLEKGFWLSEFGVFAKTDKHEEVLLYYATLGDSPQPVNAYQDNRIDVRRYPISIQLEVDADVQISYTPGAFVTAEEAQELVNSLVHQSISDIGTAIITDIEIPVSAWHSNESPLPKGCAYTAEVPVEGSKEEHFPIVSPHIETEDIIKAAGLSHFSEAVDGAVVFWSRNKPEDDIAVTVVLMSNHLNINDSTGSTFVLPIATETRLGGVKIGKGVQITADGKISVDAAGVVDEGVATAEDIDSMLEDIFDEPGSGST